MARVLVGCEVSGVVRDAFIAKGHDAISCDLQPTLKPGPHHQGSVFDLKDEQFDLAIFHPPCTYIAHSGARHLYKEDAHGMPVRNTERWEALHKAAEFFKACLNWNAPRVACENPRMLFVAKKIIGHKGTIQWIQPYQFGHKELKLTGLWLRRLPKLAPTNDVEAEMRKLPATAMHRNYYIWRSDVRGALRSFTYSGVAEAMATQWGRLL